MKNSVLFSVSREEVTWGYPFSLFTHYGFNRLVLVFNMLLLLIRHDIARGRKQLEEKQRSKLNVSQSTGLCSLPNWTFAVFDCPGDASGLWTPVQVI